MNVLEHSVHCTSKGKLPNTVSRTDPQSGHVKSWQSSSSHSSSGLYKRRINSETGLIASGTVLSSMSFLRVGCGLRIQGIYCVGWD